MFISKNNEYSKSSKYVTETLRGKRRS